MSSITYLSIPPTKLSIADQVHLRLTRLARDNWLFRSLRKRNERIVLSNAVARHPTAAITHKMARMLHVFSASNRKTVVNAVKQRVLRGDAALRATLTKKGMMHIIQSGFNRVRGRTSPEQLAELPPTQTTHGEHRRFRMMLLRSIAVQARNCIRKRRRLIKRALVQQIAPTIASTFVSAFFEKHMYTFTRRVQDHRERHCRRHNVSIIETAWCQYLERRRHRDSRKHRLLTLLSAAHAQCAGQEAQLTVVCEATTVVACQANARILVGGAQCLASRLIQRVWRGYQARQRVNRILSAKNRKALNKLQRERVRKAQAALLTRTPQELAQEQLLRARIEARSKPTPIQITRLRNKMLQPHSSVLEPLTHHAPPQLSSITGARVMRVGFSKYEKIRAQHAQVNPLNLWVAIPVGFHSTGDCDDQQERSSEQGRVSRKRQSRHLKTDYDWVPATLLNPVAK